MIRKYEKKEVKGFHVDHFPQGHRATNYEKWMKMKESNKSPKYQIEYEQYFEPYIVVKNDKKINTSQLNKRK